MDFNYDRESLWKNHPMFSGRTMKEAVARPLADNLRNAPPVIVLAGIADCKLYVVCEWLLDKFGLTFPKIPVRKIPMSQAEWPDYIENLTRPRGWPANGEIIIFREALGNPFLHIGGRNHFRMYLKQLYNFSSTLIPKDLIEGHIHQNHLELKRAKAEREKLPEPEDTWKVAVISHNHMEIIPLNLLHCFGMENILGGNKRVELTIHNSSQKYSERLNYNWNQEPVNCYFEENQWRFSFLKSAEYSDDLGKTAKNKDLIIILWAMRDQFYEVIAGRGYTFREGMDKELTKIFCGEILPEFQDILTGISGLEKKTKFLFASTRFKTPLSAIASYFLQKNLDVPPGNLLVNSCIIDKNYTSVIAEEIGVRSVDVAQTAMWGSVGGIMMMDPTQAKVNNHNYAYTLPRAVDYWRPLLEVFWDAKKLQVEFAVDAPRRAHYLELLEGPRCNSVLVTESTTDLLRNWYGNPKTTATEPINQNQNSKTTTNQIPNSENPINQKPGVTENQPENWVNVGVVTTLEMGASLAAGLVIVMPVKFSPDGTFQFINQNARDEVRTACKKVSAELCEFLAVMKENFDADLPDPPNLNQNLPAINIIPETESQNQEVAFSQPRGISEVSSIVSVSAGVQVVAQAEEVPETATVEVPVVVEQNETPNIEPS